MLKSVTLTKRLFDVAASVAGLAVMAPLMPVIAIAIRLDSKGPIFYKQVRAGRLLDFPTKLWE